jgi:hypothetical protein
VRPYHKKNPSLKRAHGVVQVVEQLPSKCKALSSNPSTTKKKKKKEKIKVRVVRKVGGERNGTGLV